LADRALLCVAIGASEHDARFAAFRLHNHPALGAPVVGRRRHIFDDDKVEDAHEEIDRRVVVRNDEREERELRHACEFPSCAQTV
jgi:hypothetical protein